MRGVPSDRKLRKFIGQWRKRYPYPVEWVDNRANKQCRRSEAAWLAPYEGVDALRRRDVAALIEWTFGAQPDVKEVVLAGITGPAASGHARRCIRKALATSSPMLALDFLLGERAGIPGWGPVMASAVLCACRPDTYAAGDPRRLRSLSALGLYRPCAEGQFLREDWLPYLRACRRIGEVCDVTLRGVGQALWAAADHAPKLPPSPPPRGQEATP